MAFNFFNQKSETGWAQKALLVATHTISRNAPSLSARIGKPLLMSPRGRRNVRFEVIQPTQSLKIPSKAGEVHVHLFGSGNKTVVLSHGWADTSAVMERMIADLVKQGFQVAAIDQVGHGLSYGKQSHLLAFIEALELVIAHFEADEQAVTALIGHSMGGLAILNLPEALLVNRNIVFISMPVNFFASMFNTVERMGISRLLLVRVLESISPAYGKSWMELKSENNQHKLHDQMLFVHDRYDRVAPFSETHAYTKGKKAAFFQTEGLGHRRIVSDTGVIELIRNHMAVA